MIEVVEIVDVFVQCLLYVVEYLVYVVQCSVYVGVGMLVELFDQCFVKCVECQCCCVVCVFDV